MTATATPARPLAETPQDFVSRATSRNEQGYPDTPEALFFAVSPLVHLLDRTANDSECPTAESAPGYGPIIGMATVFYRGLMEHFSVTVVGDPVGMEIPSAEAAAMCAGVAACLILAGEAATNPNPTPLEPAEWWNSACWIAQQLRDRYSDLEAFAAQYREPAPAPAAVAPTEEAGR